MDARRLTCPEHATPLIRLGTAGVCPTCLALKAPPPLERPLPRWPSDVPRGVRAFWRDLMAYAQAQNPLNYPPEGDPLSFLEAVRDWSTTRRTLFIQGPAGCGKSTVMQSLRLRWHAQDLPSFYGSWVKYVSELRASYNGGVSFDRSVWLSTPILILDDLDRASVSAQDERSEAYALFLQRRLKNKTTYVLSRASAHTVEEGLSLQGCFDAQLVCPTFTGRPPPARRDG
jgi:hypothetical protein